MMSPANRQHPQQKPSYGLEGKTALITGAGSGLGAYFASILAEHNVGLVLVGRRTTHLKAVARSLNTRTLCYKLDIRKPAQIAGIYDRADVQGMPIDILVNNAGANYGNLALNMTRQDYDATMDTNVRGSYFVAQEMARRAIAANRAGRIINIASIGGHKVLPGLSVYCMSKAAMLMMSRALAREWANKHINVNAICPGYIATELNAEWFASPAGRMQRQRFARKRLGRKEDLREALLTFASFATDGITGATLTVDDAQSL